MPARSLVVCYFMLFPSEPRAANGHCAGTREKEMTATRWHREYDQRFCRLAYLLFFSLHALVSSCAYLASDTKVAIKIVVSISILEFYKMSLLDLQDIRDNCWKLVYVAENASFPPPPVREVLLCSTTSYSRGPRTN